jgi:1,2-diacylglycerol 3-alpha-glucosyltransferase
MKSPIRVAVHWRRFGPYHIARLNAACCHLRSIGVDVIGLETASYEATNLWQQETAPTEFSRQIVFPQHNYEDISALYISRGIYNALARINPDIVAICGYSTPDALSALFWCKLHNRKTILMMESKQDDASRKQLKEWIKQQIVRYFDTALCGGTLHREYLIQLGMLPTRIFFGYDAVDNTYFQKEANHARENPAAYNQIPGLHSDHPFFLASSRFIRRKNLDSLIKAYAQYRQRIADSSAWRLIILGDGEERDNLHRLANGLELSNVLWPGFRQISELPTYYGLAGAFIHPARQEQWGLVVNEAMAAGLPVLVSRTCGCVPDLVLEGETGFTFDPEDTSTLASLMVRVSSGQVDRQAMGRAAQRHINQWGTKRFARGLYGAIQTAISNN